MIDEPPFTAIEPRQRKCRFNSAIEFDTCMGKGGSPVNRFLKLQLEPRTWAEVLPDTEEWADLDGDLMANPPLAELFFRSFDVRPSADEHDDGGRDGCLTSRRLDDAPYANPSRGTTVTTTDAFRPPPPPPSSRRGIRGISRSSRSSPMAPRGPESLSGRRRYTIV